VTPTMLLVGLVVGAFVHDDRSLNRSFILGAGASVLWGFVVGVATSSLLNVVGGTAFGLVNVAAGAFVGWGLRSVFRVIREHTKPPAPSR
jgi:hypothetical protein